MRASCHMNIACPYDCLRSAPVVRNGFYRRKSDSRRVLRFKCQHCRRAFSQATGHPCVGQNKRRVNHALGRLLTSGVSQRRCAMLLNIHRTTVARKHRFLGLQAKQTFDRTVRYASVTTIQFDDLETTEHTKLKPVSVSLAVDANTRKILALQVSRMPAKGLLARKSRQKYGLRRDDRLRGLDRMFASLKEKVTGQVTFKSDSNPLYPLVLRRHFKTENHETVISRKGCIVGQGELKKIGFDPLFSLNHTCAMLRANINRLFRRTWCTSKKLESLEQHLYLYAKFHNSVLTPNSSPQSRPV